MNDGEPSAAFIEGVRVGEDQLRQFGSWLNAHPNSTNYKSSHQMAAYLAGCVAGARGYTPDVDEEAATGFMTGWMAGLEGKAKGADFD